MFFWDVKSSNTDTSTAISEHEYAIDFGNCILFILRFTIKRNSSMACFESAHLRFVVITNFIATESNFAGDFKALRLAEPKGFFPYQWVDSLE